jgi:DNA-binding MarR family transcriptional regulator
MQVSPAATDPQIHDLAGRLLLVWKELTSLAGGDVVAVLEDLDLSLTQVKTLEIVSAAAERPSVKALSEEIGCSLANSSRAVDALVRRGLLVRREDEHDRRVKRLGLTADGRAALARVDAARLAALERFAGRLEAGQRAALLAALDDVTAPLPAP